MLEGEEEEEGREGDKPLMNEIFHGFTPFDLLVIMEFDGLKNEVEKGWRSGKGRERRTVTLM